MANNEEGAEPMTKRQKCGDGVEPSPSFGGGPMHDEATARKILKETVLISEEIQEQYNDVDLEEFVMHFDPDKLDSLYYVDDDYYFPGVEITPMIYFAVKGDAKMCRYLMSRGASTTKSSSEGEDPMYVAAETGQLDVCKLLYANGAAQNIFRKGDVYGNTPFHAAAASGVASESSRDEVVRWLLFHDALCAGVNSEEIKGDLIYPEVLFAGRQRTAISRSCERLVEWAKDVTQTHSAVVTFLGGVLPPALGEDQTRTLQCLSVHPGIREHIGDFVGLDVTKEKHLRILRQVVDVLPSFIHERTEDLPS